MKKILFKLLTIGLLALPGFHAQAGTTVTAGTISIINGPGGLDLSGDIPYAINFNDVTRSVKGVNFVSDSTPPAGATLVGPQNVVNWAAKPDFGDGADNDALEEIYADIRWANAGAGQKLEAHLAVTAGQNYKLQILIGANQTETRRWDIQVEGVTSVDEITSLGATDVDGNLPAFAANERVVFTQWIKATDSTLDIVMGNLGGASDGGDRNAIWQAIILQKMPSDALSSNLDLLAYWPFNDSTNPASSTDMFRGRTGELLIGGNATPTAYTPDAGGRSGLAGDKGMDFGQVGGNGTGMRVAMGEFMNIAASQNQFAVSYWQKLYAVTANTAFKAISPSSSGGQRGASGHATWSDNNFYFDTAGCCDGGTQRISVGKDALGPLNLVGTWHHIVFQKNVNTKEIWVDGKLLRTGTNTAPLPEDFTVLEVGHNEANENVAGIFDEFAVFADALTPDQILQLFGGVKPNDLVSNADKDGDGMPNTYEELYGLDPSVNDAGLDKDTDGLTNIKEYQIGTNPAVADTDGDGLKDGAEITATTDPKKADTDGDGLSDGQEVNTTLTNPKAVDTDSDNYADGAEVAQGTDPKSASSYPLIGTTVGAFTGGDPGEGLDMAGSFLFAFNVGTPGAAPGPVQDVVFTSDTEPGITVNAQNEIPNWNAPNYGATANDDNLEFVMQSIRWSAAPNVPTVDLDGLIKGKVYKVQLLFAEGCCTGRGFDVEAEGAVKADEFNPSTIQGGSGVNSKGAVVIIGFVATDTTLNIVLNGPGASSPSFNDRNAILSGVTLETLNLPDTDGDGLADVWELQYFGNLAQTAAGDQDADGSPNSGEFANNTNPKVADTDGDGLNDKAEQTAGTNPLNPDMDRDGLTDGQEVLIFTTDPTKADTDGDTWDDAAELNWPTNAKLATSFPALDPAKLDLLAFWNFNDNAAPAIAKDSQHQFVANFLGATAYSADSGGRTGTAGDRAMNLGTTGGNNGAVVNTVRWFGLGIPADESLPDQVAISFWQKVATTPDSSSFWVTSPSSNNGQRGFQAHVPWSNGQVYFDTAGCCDANTQRVNGPGGIVPNVWEHYVFQKNGGTKQVWQNGILLLTSEDGTRLPNDFINLYMGAAPNSNAIRGFIDDFAVFGESLTEAQVKSLAGGASPPSLVAPVAPPVLPVTNVQYNAVTKLFSMTWNSVSGKTYKVEYSQTMAATSWLTAAASVPAVGASTSYTANLATLYPAGVPAKFYMRVKEN